MMELVHLEKANHLSRGWYEATHAHHCDTTWRKIDKSQWKGQIYRVEEEAQGTYQMTEPREMHFQQQKVGNNNDQPMEPENTP